VHIYDAGFHLPYYGPDVDWLKTEIDHSHRLSRSYYLPEHLQVVDGLNNLPTLTRIYGVVEIDTAAERRAAARKAKTSSGDILAIQVSRDRLVDNKAYQQLFTIVRTAIDLYAMRETARRLDEVRARLNDRSVKDIELPDIQKLIEDNKARLAPDLYESLVRGLRAIMAKTSAFRELAALEVGLVGSLATAGITSLALEHESNKELIVLDGLADDIEKLAGETTREHADAIASELRAWIQRTRAIRAALSPLLDEDDRSIRERLNARAVMMNVVNHTRIFTRGIPISASEVSDGLLLPHGSMAEWSAIFQNVFINATNALLDTQSPSINISSHIVGRRRAILVQDNGVGIDIGRSESLFRPFAREARISTGRRALGLGGTGLGLTIVRMIAGALNAQVHFVEPQPDYSTAFELSWTEEDR
jgi:C4-dicarboxylate-specific signal transduction histidine kinase